MKAKIAVALVSLLVFGACRTASPPPVQEPEGETETLVVYSGRSEELVGPILQRFEMATGIKVEVKYGDTAEMAALLLEEGDRTPADLFFAQDAGALGAIAKEGMFTGLSEDLLEQVPPKFRASAGNWIGITGRARVAVFNTEALEASDLPASILDFTDPAWKGRLGWAPTNGSFQAFVTALRLIEGDDAARAWLEGIKANEPTVFDGNTPIVEATGRGEIEVGFVNHYYLLRLKSEDPGIAAENHFFPEGAGSLINLAGVGILSTSEKTEAAIRLIDFLLSEEGQTYFVEETFEYPLVEGVGAPEGAPPLEEVPSPDIDLSDIDDLEGTLEMLEEAGLI